MNGSPAGALVAALMACRCAAATNLISHPDFDAASELAQWSVAGNGLPEIIWDGAQSATGAASGSGSVLLRIDGGAGTGGWIESVCLPAKGAFHRVSAWTKTARDQSGSGPADRIGLLVNYFGNAACVPEFAVGSSGLSYPTTEAWTWRHFDSPVPAGALSAKVVVSLEKGPGNSAVLTTWFDGIAFETEEIFHGGFESQWKASWCGLARGPSSEPLAAKP